MKRSILRGFGIGAPTLIGYGLFSLSGVAMWLFMMYWFLQWWGLLGIVVALLLPPLATLFPFIYWWQESFPLTYILIWLIGVLALVTGVMLTGTIAMRASNKKAKKLKRNIIDGEVVD